MTEQDPNIIPMDDQPAKPQYIAQQTNNNCQQFFGPVTGCVFAMPGATVAPPVVNTQSDAVSKKNRVPKAEPSRSPRSRIPQTAETKQHGVERDTFSCSRYVTQHHLNLLFHQLQEEGWVSSRSNEVDFRDLFSGKVSSCEIIWTGEIGIGTLKELFNTMLEEQLISLPPGARSVNKVLENHFVDENGHFVSGLNSSTPADSAYQTIQKFVESLKIRPQTDDIKQGFDELESWDPSYR